LKSVLADFKRQHKSFVTRNYNLIFIFFNDTNCCILVHVDRTAWDQYSCDIFKLRLWCPLAINRFVWENLHSKPGAPFRAVQTALGSNSKYHYRAVN